MKHFALTVAAVLAGGLIYAGVRQALDWLVKASISGLGGKR